MIFFTQLELMTIQTPMKTFEELGWAIKPHHSHAQVLLEVKTRDQTLRKALDIFKSFCVSPIACELLSRKNPNWYLLRLPCKDMREFALRLTEAGFERVIGINAKITPNPDSSIRGFATKTRSLVPHKGG